VIAFAKRFVLLTGVFLLGTTVTPTTVGIQEIVFATRMVKVSTTAVGDEPVVAWFALEDGRVVAVEEPAETAERIYQTPRSGEIRLSRRHRWWSEPSPWRLD
jgi:hypothetical protein